MKGLSARQQPLLCNYSCSAQFLQTHALVFSRTYTDLSAPDDVKRHKLKPNPWASLVCGQLPLHHGVSIHTHNRINSKVANLLIRKSYTYIYTPMEQPVGAIWGLVSCPRTLRHADQRIRGSEVKLVVNSQSMHKCILLLYLCVLLILFDFWFFKVQSKEDFFVWFCFALG